jgi:hypothetical protein
MYMARIARLVVTGYPHCIAPPAEARQVARLPPPPTRLNRPSEAQKENLIYCLTEVRAKDRNINRRLSLISPNIPYNAP